MSDMISRDDAIALIEGFQRELCPAGMYGRHAVYGSDRDKFEDWQFVIDELEKIPTVDAVPVVHAHWIEYYTDIMCSHCHATYKDEIVDTYQDSVDHRRYVGLEHCPHCGSIMDGGDDDADGETQLSAEWKNELRPVQADIDDAYYEYGRKHQEGERWQD